MILIRNNDNSNHDDDDDDDDDVDDDEFCNFVILISAFRGQSHQGKDKKFVCVVKTLLITLVFFKQLLHQTMSFSYNVCGL